MKSTRIYTIPQLITAANQRKSVVGWNWKAGDDNPKPAAFVLGMPALLVAKRLNAGLYLYEPLSGGKRYGRGKR